MTTTYDPSQVAFQSAINGFKSRIKDDKLLAEILKTSSIEEVYDFTDKLQAEQAKNGHLRHLSKIGPFLEHLRDYSGAIDTFVQAKPSILAFLWGPIKLLIQWTSVLKQSFDAIINITAEIGEVLPEFKQVSELFSQNTQLKGVLVLFFQDVLEFYLIALEFFTKPRWRIIFESLWPKQRDKIKVVQRHIERLTDLMRNEVRLEHIRGEHDARIRALEHFEMTEKSSREQEYHILETAVLPKFHDDKLDWLRGHICDGTGKWLMRDTTFIKWLDIGDLSTKIVWLQGIPGAGKTFLTGIVIANFKAADRVIYVFLSHVFTATSALSVLHSLIFQLALKDDDAKTALIESNRANLKNDVKVAASLLMSLLNCAGPVYVLVDGVDEIDEIERERLLRQLLEISENCNEAKILVSCRPEADVTSILAPVSVSIRVDRHNAGSIQTYVNRQSHDWFQKRDFLYKEQMEIKGLLAPIAANAKGMFLYAKILLGSIEFLNDVKSVREELKVLPEDLDAAYARIFARINSLPSASARKTARNILGWIGCSPTPMTIQELEQALMIDFENKQSSARISSKVNLVQLCGPIVEVVDEYAQYVHFTVKEYMFNPRITSFIDGTAATLDLAKSCIWYLCQSHHDPWVTDEDIAKNIISGDYKLHNYAATMWIELVKQYVRLTGSKPLSPDLIRTLEYLMTDRSRSRGDASMEMADQFRQSELEKFKGQWPDLHAMLCHAAYFLWKCSSSEFHLERDHMWASHDPLIAGSISAAIYRQFDGLWCQKSKHDDICNCRLLEHHYGQRPFKCGYLGCSFRRHGFAMRTSRQSHERYHGRPWKCSVPSCEYAETGFLSRRMRDEHVEFGHRDAESQSQLSSSQLDEDEVQSLLFDLVRLDKAEAVRALLPHSDRLAYVIKEELANLAASSGSLAMIQSVFNHYKNTPRNYTATKQSTISMHILLKCIESENVDALRWLLPLFKDIITGDWWNISDVIRLLLATEHPSMFQDYEKSVIDEICDTSLYRTRAPGARALTLDIIKVTARRSDRENRLLSLWAALEFRNGVSKFKSNSHLTSALAYVADTTCSLALAKALIGYGANINHKRNAFYHTPLHRAAQKSSPETADFIRFLLYQGANPELKGGRSEVSISEEKGAKEIAKWLDMSWDELVQKVRSDRENGICPPEYRISSKNT